METDKTPPINVLGTKEHGLTPEQVANLPITETIEDRIKNLPALYNVTDAKLGALKRKYAGLTAIDENGDFSPSKYKEVTDALSVLRSLRTAAKETKETLNKDALLWQRAVNAEEKKIVEAVSKIEQSLKDEKQRADDIKEEAKRRKEKQEAEAYNNRINLILGNGMAYTGDKYQIEEIFVEPTVLKDMSEQDFVFLLDSVKIQKQRLDEAKAAREQEEKEEREKQQREAEKLKKEQEEFKIEQEKFRKQQDDFKRQQEEQERLRIESETKQQQESARIEKEKEAARVQMLKSRQETLFNLGMFYSDEAKGYALKDVNVAIVELQTLDSDQWQNLIAKITPAINDRKAQIAQEKAEKEEAERVQKEKERQIEEQRKEDERKEALRLQQLREQEQENRRTALLPEKAKIAEYIEKVGPMINDLSESFPALNDAYLRDLGADFTSKSIALFLEFKQKFESLK